MNFQESYDWLISLSNFPRKEYMSDPRHCSWYLKRLQFFLDILGNPEKKIPHYIHVTGTSGKGSVTTMMHSILHESGKSVGSTYSPHPTTILERWKVGNKHMTKKEFVELIEYIKPKLDKYIKTTPYDMLSFFELTEAIGFVYFAKKKVNWVVLEVACGGRYDSSNIIPKKDVAIITNIDLDHVGIIGNNKEEIAYEKSGIIKPGCAVFTQERNKKILEVINKECRKNKTSLNQVNNKINYELNVLGEHQQKNAALCSAVAKHLDIPENKIKAGLLKIRLPIRMEIVSKKPLIILDGAHNPDKIKSTVNTINELANLQTFKPVNLIIGFSENKDTTSMIRQLSKLEPKSIACTRYTNNPFRKVTDPADTAKKFKKILPNSKIAIFLDPSDALNWSKKQKGLILATGSIFLSGELREKLTN
jgi:dihydrofolate synthase / folylpolyglutamate synthase